MIKQNISVLSLKYSADEISHWYLTEINEDNFESIVELPNKSIGCGSKNQDFEIYTCLFPSLPSPNWNLFWKRGQLYCWCLCRRGFSSYLIFCLFRACTWKKWVLKSLPLLHNLFSYWFKCHFRQFRIN